MATEGGEGVTILLQNNEKIILHQLLVLFIHTISLSNIHFQVFKEVPRGTFIFHHLLVKEK